MFNIHPGSWRFSDTPSELNADHARLIQRGSDVRPNAGRHNCSCLQAYGPLAAAHKTTFLKALSKFKTLLTLQILGAVALLFGQVFWKLAVLLR